MRAGGTPAIRSLLRCTGLLGDGEQRVIERQRGAVGDHGARLVEPDMSAIAGIERQLFELGPGDEPVLAEMLDQEIAGVAAHFDMVRGKGVMDYRGEIARAV